MICLNKLENSEPVGFFFPLECLEVIKYAIFFALTEKDVENMPAQ